MSTRQIFAYAGAAIGGYFGGAAGAQAGYAIGGAIGNEIDPVVINGPKIGDTAVQTSAEGAYRSIIYGTAAVSGNLFWTGPKIIKKQKDQAAKGSGPVTVSERLYQSFAIRICEGPASGILRIWQDEKLVYDVREGSSIPEDSTEYATKFVLHLGTEEQLPDSEIESVLGVGNAPAYRGSCYVVFPKFDLTDRAGSIPQYRFEVVAQDADITWSPKVVTNSAFYPGTIENLTRHATDALAGLNITWYRTLAMSPDNKIVVGTFYVAPILRAFKFDRELNDLVQIPIDGDIPASAGYAVDFSPDGRYVAVGSGDLHPLRVYKVNSEGLTFYRYASTTSPSQEPPTVKMVRWSPDGLYIACSCDDVSPVWLYTVDLVHETFYLQSKSVSFGSTNGRRIEWRPGGGMLAYGDGPQLWILSTATSPISILYYNGSLPGGAYVESGLIWSGYLDFIYCISPSEPYLSVFRLLDTPSGFELQPYESPEQPTSAPHDAQATFDRRHVIIATGSGDFGEIVTYRTNLMNDMQIVGEVSTVAEFKIALAGGPSVGSGSAVPGTLSAIVSDIIGRCGMSDNSFSVEELDEPVAGFVLSGSYTGAAAINTLRSAFFFDASEYEKRIWFPKRGKPVVATLTYDDLAEEPETSTRQDAQEYPAKLHLEYQNAITGYKTAKSTSSRSSSDIRVTGESSVSLPVVMDSTEAQKIAVKLHKVAWADQEGEVPFTISDSWMELVASDSIALNLRGRVDRLRIENIEYQDGELKLTCKYDRQSAYTTAVTGVPLPEPTPPPTNIVGSTIFEILDIPALVDVNDLTTPVEYAAMSGTTSAWYGALLQRSTDSGATYSNVLTESVGTLIGSLVSEVPDASPHYKDSTNRVIVQLYNAEDTIESISESQFLSEGGPIAIRSEDGTWEIMQYRDAEQLSDGSWELSPLLRGRLDTTSARHVAGARVVFLDGVKLAQVGSALIGSTLTYRATSNGKSTETGTVQSHVFTAQSQREWAVASLEVERSGSNIFASWAPRHRFGTEVNPIASINFQGYRVTLAGSSTISFDTTESTFTYDASALGATVDVSVSSLNRITGPGPAVTETV